MVYVALILDLFFLPFLYFLFAPFSHPVLVLCLLTLMAFAYILHLTPFSDSGAWIPPPAQRSGLQPHPGPPGHRLPLRSHQTVSSVVPIRPNPEC